MSDFILAGPFPFDEQNATSSARNALAEVNISLKEREGRGVLDQPSTGAEAGIYVIVDVRDEPGIAGFWLVHGANYLEVGPAGPPDKTPPLVNHLLDAATEEVWWKNLLVAGRVGDTWTPRVVLEWPGFLASRSVLPPPGVPTKTISDEDAQAGEAEGWMDPVSFMEEEVGGFYGETGGFYGDDQTGDAGDFWGEEVQPEDDVSEENETPTNATKTVAELEDPWAGLPLQRSLVCVVKGKLTYDSKAHHGAFEVVRWSLWQEGGPRTPVAMSAWMDDEGLDEGPSAHGWGSPLDLPGGRVAFPITGWLTRDLGIWPPLPEDVLAGTLTERDVSNPVRQKVMLALSLTAGNLLLILLLAVTVAWLAEPTPQATTPPPALAPQPALSLCSADHAAFVNEFRCQIRRMADGADPSDPDCGDSGPSAGPSFDDLQASYCGLLDRQQDGQAGNYPWLPPNDADRKYNYAQLAAAQACFNVLDKPFAYEQKWDYDLALESPVADPDRFLKDKALGIQPLMALMKDLDQACETYRSRVEFTIEGAAVATHVGSPMAEDPEAKESESAALRRAIVTASTADLPEKMASCFRYGASEGVSGQRYEELCGEVDLRDSYFNGLKAWQALAGDPDQERDLVSRYATARFGEDGMGGAPEVWQCHEKLTTGEPSYQSELSLWDQYAPVITGSGYDPSGRRAVKTQLAFDAVYRDIDENQAAGPGVCWELIEKRAVAYQPVHPLLAELDDSAWVSSEQQLCAQVCAARYNVKSSESQDSWVTRDGDLGACLRRDPTDPGAAPRSRRGSTDRLLLPWNQSRGRWMADTEDNPKVERCAGNKPGAWMPYPYSEGARGAGNDEVWICPTAAQVCAFNLIAQNYMPPGEAGYLVGSRSPRSWAGETSTSSQIAGGYPGRGLASTAADNLSSYGRSRSKNTCGHAAVQCFTGMMLQTMGREGSARYEWREAWSLSIDDLAATPLRQVAQEYGPWCAVVHPYMSPGGNLPEGQIDYPCAMGVDEALRTVEATLAEYERAGEEEGQ
ncbi:MAG: hypothetical protein VX899_19190 [Myxococcota bacterium]|nr:hypothetical protein [Myxococcota bacterium]